jgi:uncharacterized protein (DUF58 family)
MKVNTDVFLVDYDKNILSRRYPWYWLALLLLVSSLFSQQPLLFLAALFTFIVAVVPNLWYRHALRHLVVDQQVNHRNVFYGEEVTLSVRLENHKFLPLPWLKVENKIVPPLAVVSKKTLHLQNLRRDTLAGIWLLWAFQRVTRQYRLRCQERGFHRFGPMRLYSSDPFGWLQCEVTVPALESLVVYPLIAPLEALGLSSVHPLGEHTTVRRLLEDPLRVAGVRDYVLGDDPRRIHWKASAHAGALRSKVYETPALRRLLLLLDVWNYSEEIGGTDPEIQELTIAVAASLGMWALDEGYMVGLLANCSMMTPSAGLALPVNQPAEESETIKVDKEEFAASDLSPAIVSIPFASDYGHYERLLSTLARLVPRYYGSIGTLIDTEETMFPLGTTILLISATSSLHEGTIERLLDLRMRGAAVHLIVTGNPEASVNVETYDLPVHSIGGKEKWRELIRTVGNEKSRTVGTSTSVLRLD